MASRLGRFSSFTRALFGRSGSASRPERASMGKQFVELENRSVPATFVVTNILDSTTDVVGGLSLRAAINAANANPGFDRIEFNIPRSPSLPTLPDDPTENYFPIVLASTLPALTDPAGVVIDASTQPRNNVNGTRPIVQLLPDPNPGAFPGSVGAFIIRSSNNVFRGFVVTGFPGAAFNFTSPSSFNNQLLGNWINTDISGTKPWSEDPFILSARPPGTPPELTNTGPNKATNPLFVLAGVTITDGANNNVIGGVIDKGGVPLIDAGGKIQGTGGSLFRYDSKGNLIDTGIPITPSINRNVISGTPEFRKDYFDYIWALDGSTKTRQREIAGAAVGPGIRIMDPNTKDNLIQGNFIGTDVTGNRPIPNHNGIEIFNSATSNLIGNPSTFFVGDPVENGLGNLIRFNENDGIRTAQHPNPSQINPPPPPVPGPPEPYQEGFVSQNTTLTGQFGPAGAVFYDAYNPNYFIGVSPTGGNILTIGRTDPLTGNTTPGISAQVGMEVRLLGSGLLSTSSVTFTSVVPNQTVPAKYTVVNDSEIRVIVPAGAATGAVRVFTPAGVSKIPQAVILPSPPTEIEVISTFSPSSGTAGTKVTIFGTNFTGLQTISFGGVLATDFTVAAGGKQVEVTVPTGALSGAITLTGPGGAVSTNRAFQVLTQPPPVITDIDLSTALPNQEVTLTGTNLLGAYLVRFNFSGGGSGFATTDLTVDSPTQIRVRVPKFATASTGPIQVVTNDGFGVSLETLQILTPPAPIVSTISSASGPIGTILTITGTNFSSANRVTIGGIDATTFRIVNANTITANVPLGLPLNVAAPVRVISTGGTGLGPNFTPTPSPAPTVDPIPFAVRNTFTVVNGTNLLGTTKVLFGNAVTGTPAPTVEVLSDTQIRIQIPPAVAASGNFFVFTPFNNQNPLAPPASNTYVVAPSSAPTIGTGRLSDPISGVIGQKITLRGQGFIGTQEVRFNSSLGAGVTVPATELNIVSDFEINFRVPQFAITGPITIISPGSPDTNTPFDPADPTEVTTTPFAFTVLPNPAPVINAISPGKGTVGSLVSITGRGFLGTAQVTIGGAEVTDFTIFEDTGIIARVPILAQDGPITVTTPGGTVTSSTSFDVVESGLPTIAFSSPRAARNTQVTIVGGNLAGTTKVQFNDVLADFKVISDGLITAVVPITAGPGEIRVTTVAGSVSSPTPFDLEFVAPPSLAVGSEEVQDAGPVGSKVFINGANLSGVFRVEIGGASAKFDIISKTKIMFTIPEMDPGTYTVTVYASTKDQNDAGNTGLGTNSATSFAQATNILGTKFTYGEKVTVVPNARPQITLIAPNDTNGGAPVAFERGAPIIITGSGFLGTNRVSIDGNDITNLSLFTVVSDSTITMNIPNDKTLAGTKAIPGALVQVFTPHGAVGNAKDDLPSLQKAPIAAIDIAASAPLTFDVPATALTYGSQITLTAKTGTFYSASRLYANAKDNSLPVDKRVDLGTNVFSPQVAPLSGATLPFQNFTIVPGTGGTKAIALVPVGFAKIPEPVDNQNDPPQTLAKLANIDFFAVTNAGDVQASKELQVSSPENITISKIVSLATNKFDVFNNTYRIIGNKGLIALSGLEIDAAPGGPFGIGRNSIEVYQPDPFNPNLWFAEFKMPTIRNPFVPQQTINWPTGQVKAFNAESEATTNFQPIDQLIPQLLVLTNREAPPQDNRYVANRIFDNGLTPNYDPTTGLFIGVTPKDQATQFVDGSLGLDFVTQLPNAAGFPFQYGFAHEKQGAQTSPYPAGNQGRGGLNDGVLNSFTLPPGISGLPGTAAFAAAQPGSIPFEADRTSGAYLIIGQNTFNNTQFGRYFGPNLLQNFPLLQVVQSTADRTTFSTALIAKPFRTYRIDYYYNPGLDNQLSDAELDPFLSSQTGFTNTSRFDDQDITARKTTNIGEGQIYLGSKFITTNSQGDGSVSFEIYRRLPTIPGDPNSVPPAQPGDFFLPGNTPLFPSIIDPVTGIVTLRAGVVVATATDLTAPSPQGPITTTGPDGTSRFSFFKRVDTPTGGISGRVILDVNQNGKADPGEPGVQDARVDIFIQKSDTTYNPVPSQSFFTSASGSYAFGLNSGYGLPNGTHKLVLTLPTGKQLFFALPIDGKQSVTIINGEEQGNRDFLVVDTPFGTPPTISAIPDQNVAPGTTVGPLAFTIGDAETPPDQLVLSAQSSNGAFIPVGNIVFGGAGANRTVTVTLPPGVNDVATIVITVTDTGGQTASSSFTITAGVVGPNQPPTITAIPNQTGIPNTPIPVTFTIGDLETPVDSLILTAKSSNTNLIPNVNLVFTGTGANRTLTITPVNGLTGTSQITVTVTDGGGLTASRTFTVTINNPGAAPSLLAVGSDAGRVATVNVYNPDGTFRYSFQPYGAFTGGVRVATGDVTGDGNADVVTAPGPGMGGLVLVFDGPTGNLVGQFVPYGDEFRGGVYVVLGDVDGDGIQDLVTGTGKGGGPRVRVLRGGLNASGQLPFESIADFFPYESKFRGGVLVAAGDVNGDGKADIVTGTGVGGGPRVRVLDGTKLQSDELVPPSQVGAGTIFDFFAYDNRFRGGVFATVGNVDPLSPGAEIITGTGLGGGAAVKIFRQSDFAGGPQPVATKSFFAYDPSFRGGVRVDVLDANNDGIADIVTAPGAGIPPDVRVINYTTLQDIYRIQAFESSFNGGVFVGGNVQ